MRLNYYTFSLKLNHTFKIAHGSRNVQKTLIVELTNGDFSGYGEATATPYYQHTIKSMIRVLEENRMRIESYNGEHPERFWEQLNPFIGHNKFVQCSIDVAAWDLYGRMNNKRLVDIWNNQIKNMPVSSYTIGIDTIDAMVAKMSAQPWPIYKIKLGTDNDLKIVQALRNHSKTVFRVDANCAWDADFTIKNSFKLKELNVEFIEQPLIADNWQGMKEVFDKSALPVIADESCTTEDTVKQCKGYFHGINIKLMKCGGLTPARRMIQEARMLGLQVMVGCMTESTVGISAIAHLVPEVDYIDMDGAMLISNDIAKGVSLQNGHVILANKNGTGVCLNP